MGRQGTFLSEMYKPDFKLFQLQKLYKGVSVNGPYKTMERPESFIIKPRTKGSACNGDSGGPYLCNIGGVWKQFGIAGQELRFTYNLNFVVYNFLLV